MIDLYNGDCLEVMDKLIADGIKVDAIITDPPYGTTACSWDSIIPFDEMWKRLNLLIKENGVIALFGSEPFSTKLRMSNIENYRYDWYWNKNNSGNILCIKYMPLKIIENILIFSDKSNKYNPQMIARTKEQIKEHYKKNNWNQTFEGEDENKGVMGTTRFINKSLEFKYPNNLLNFSAREKECNNANRVHPTQKPVALMEYLIKTYTDENETVLDFTMGSGSTGVACCMCNRNFIGIELDKNYFEIAKKRINNTYIQQELFYD